MNNAMLSLMAVLMPANVVDFTRPAAWECPAGVGVVYVECWGAGGATEGLPTSPTGGGGGGAYAAATVIVVPGKLYAIGNFADWVRFADGNAIRVLAMSGGYLESGMLGGAKGGQAADCIGTVKFSGGTGGKSFITQRGMWVCGGGGGGAGPSGPGLDGTDGMLGTLTAGIGGAGYAGGGFGGVRNKAPSWGDAGAFPNGGNGGSSGGKLGRVIAGKLVCNSGLCRISW